MLLGKELSLEIRRSSQNTGQRVLTEDYGCLHVSYFSHEENSAIGLPKSQMKALNILQGDFVTVRGHGFATTLNVDMHDLDHGTASLSRDVQKSLEILPGQLVSVKRCRIPTMVSFKQFPIS